MNDQNLPNPLDPTKLRIESGYLVYEHGEHDCVGGGPEASGMHEPGCGMTPLISLEKLAIIMAGEPTGDLMIALQTARRLIPADEHVVITGTDMWISANAYHANGTAQYTIKKRA